MFALIIGGFLFLLFRLGPEPLTLAWAKPEPNGPDASPAIHSDFDREATKATLAREVYGRWPGEPYANPVSVQTYAWNDAEVVDVTISAASGTGGATFGMTLVRKSADAPVIVWSSFSPRGAAVPLPEVAGERFEGVGGSILEYVFGRYIQSPPLEMILERGYSFAVLHPPEAFPDRASAMAPLQKMAPRGEPRIGAVMAWAWLAAAGVDALQNIDLIRGPVIAAGHSRYAKSALVWAAWDEDVDAVIAHQSGTGGASLSREKRGETIAQMMDSYPHWFVPTYAEDNLTLDQHHLLAAIAPRPILLGNARRDVWSDPNGALRAAIGAAPAWEGAGINPLPSKRLDEFHPDAHLALWMRPGTHGVVQEDWPAFLGFLDAHFSPTTLNLESGNN